MIDFKIPEFAVIGSILIDDHNLPEIRGILPSSAYFSNEHCQIAYEAICKLADSFKSIDPVSIGQETGLSNQFLAECMEIVPTHLNAPTYAISVRENHRRRQLMEIGSKLQIDSLSHDRNADDIITDARSTLDLLAQDTGGNKVLSSGDSLQEFLEYRNDMREGKCQIIKVGFPSLDSVLKGFAQGNFYIIAARTSVGKSAFAIAIADMIAKEHQVLYVSLEMSTVELDARRVAAIVDIPGCTYSKLLHDSTTDSEDAKIAQACSTLSKRKLSLSSVSDLTVAELGILAQNTKAEVVIVDYLGLLSDTDCNANERETVSKISRDLKCLSRRLKCVVIALCQLNRESEGIGADKRPKLSQLRSSGALEQDSDGVLLLHRPEYGQTEVARAPTAPQQFFIDIAKNRHGRLGTVELAWYAPVNRFEDRSGRWPVKSWA